MGFHVNYTLACQIVIKSLFLKFSFPDCWLEVSIRKFLRQATSAHVLLGFPVSIANAEMVPKTPSCCCMLLMEPSRLKFLRSLFLIYVIFISYLCTCIKTTAIG
jgi:hypothetical protein